MDSVRVSRQWLNDYRNASSVQDQEQKIEQLEQSPRASWAKEILDPSKRYDYNNRHRNHGAKMRKMVGESMVYSHIATKDPNLPTEMKSSVMAYGASIDPTQSLEVIRSNVRRIGSSKITEGFQQGLDDAAGHATKIQRAWKNTQNQSRKPV